MNVNVHAIQCISIWNLIYMNLMKAVCKIRTRMNQELTKVMNVNMYAIRFLSMGNWIQMK
jgi:hypothetical protein